jgi:hypothetical protein
MHSCGCFEPAGQARTAGVAPAGRMIQNHRTDVLAPITRGKIKCVHPCVR